MKRSTTSAAVLVAAALAFSLTACGESGDGKKADSAKPGTPAATSAVPQPSAASPSASKPGSGIPPKPTGAERDAYLAAIKVVAPNAAADPDKAIDAGRNQCMALNGGAKNPDHSAAQRFGSDAHPLTDAQGKAINVALRATMCPAG
jgi:predicted small lipoprotein YifL